MKPILLLDNTGPERYSGSVDLEYWEGQGVLDYQEKLECPENLDASAYETAFVHQSDRAAYEWAKANFSPVFIFSESTPAEHRLNRDKVFMRLGYFQDHLEGVLQRYLETGMLRQKAFADDTGPGAPEGKAPENRSQQTGRQQTDEVDETDADTSPLQQDEDWKALCRTADVITFTATADNAEKSENHFQIFYDEESESGFDVQKTLGQLRHVNEARPIFLLESYSDRREGLKEGLHLLRRIRIAAAYGLECYRWPIYIRLDSRIDEVLGDPVNAILGSEGVHVVETVSEINSGDAPPIRPSKVHERLESLPFHPVTKDKRSRHDLSNEWGLLRLMHGVSMLRGSTMEEPWRSLEHYLQDSEYYNYLLALSALREGRRLEPLKEKDASDTWVEWIRFLRRERDEAFKILLVDDEAEDPPAGAPNIAHWASAIRFLFEEGEADVEVYSGSKMFNVADAKKKATSKHWDIVLCDLLLNHRDPDRTESSDPTERESYTGLEVLAEAKKANPTAAVIAFTASNKAWTSQALRERGADGHWIKESPLRGVNDGYTAENTASLLDMIRTSVLKYERIGFIWKLISDLRAARTEGDLESTLSPLSSDPQHVRERLDGIDRLLSRAFDTLQQGTTEFADTTFKRDPEGTAFLSIWGCLNEILRLRVEKTPDRKCRLLIGDGTTKVYWDTREGFSGRRDWYKKLDDSFDFSIRPYEQKPRERGHDHEYLRFVFAEQGEQELERRFNRCREHRNGLDLIHGDASGGSQNTHLSDVKEIASLVRHGLLLVE